MALQGCGVILVERAITLTQPWATLCAIEAKRHETRSWPTKYRGWIAIHAAKGFPRDCREMCFQQPFLDTLVKAGFRTPIDLPLGKVLAVVRLTQCRSTSDWTPDPTGNEYAFGDYGPHRYSFKLEGARRMREPFDCKGMLGIWKLPRSITEAEFPA